MKNKLTKTCTNTYCPERTGGKCNAGDITLQICKCSSKTFWLTETLLWEADLEDGELNCKNKDCEIREIVCKECMREYKEEDFIINFN